MLGNFYDEEKSILTIILMGFPCKWNSCNHCYFDEEASKNIIDLLKENKNILKESHEIIKTKHVISIKIFNGGSFFELPDELYPLLKPIFENQEISIESRPELIRERSIRATFNELNPKNLNIFIGFDSFFEEIRDDVFNKGIPQSEIYRLASMSLEKVLFYSYVVFGIEGLPEESVRKSVENFNSLFSGVTAIEYRNYPGLKVNSQKSSQGLKDWLISHCLTVDFIGHDDEQWQIK